MTSALLDSKWRFGVRLLFVGCAPRASSSSPENAGLAAVQGTSLGRHSRRAALCVRGWRRVAQLRSGCSEGETSQRRARRRLDGRLARSCKQGAVTGRSTGRDRVVTTVTTRLYDAQSVDRREHRGDRRLPGLQDEHQADAALSSGWSLPPRLGGTRRNRANHEGLSRRRKGVRHREQVGPGDRQAG